MSVIGLGEIVDEESRNEGKLLFATTPHRLTYSVLLARGRECCWFYDRFDRRRLLFGTIWQSTAAIRDEAISRQAVRRSRTATVRHHNHR